MTYLLIVFAIFVALAPLLSMMPSRRQRDLADLRQAAASSGLYVKLEREDETERVFYGCRRQRGDTTALPAALHRQGDAWVQERGSWPPERIEALSELPAGVDLVREDREGIGFYWDEQGSREDVQKFARLLRALLGRRW